STPHWRARAASQPWHSRRRSVTRQTIGRRRPRSRTIAPLARREDQGEIRDTGAQVDDAERSEEHTSELQSQSKIVCRILLEKKSSVSHAFLLARGRPVTEMTYLAPAVTAAGDRSTLTARAPASLTTCPTAL